MARRKIGRVRVKVAELLRALGLDVEPEAIWMQEGFYRSRYHDLARWGVQARWLGNPAGLKDERRGEPRVGQFVSLYSYALMADCARHGLTLSADHLQGWSFVEIDAAN